MRASTAAEQQPSGGGGKLLLQTQSVPAVSSAPLSANVGRQSAATRL